LTFKLRFSDLVLRVKRALAPYLTEPQSLFQNWLDGFILNPFRRLNIYYIL